MLGSIVPRPIAFVSIIDQNSRPNLAPYSFFNVFNSSQQCWFFRPTPWLETESKRIPYSTSAKPVNWWSTWLTTPWHAEWPLLGGIMKGAWASLKK